MGSGAFLVAACRYLAAAYERALLEEGRLSEADLDQDARADIRRRVAEHCLAGIDLNPVAVQLARLSLWLTTLARGKPLNFLDHRLRAGNSLIGISPGRSLAPAGPGARVIRQLRRSSRRRGWRIRCARSRGPWRSWPRRVTTASTPSTQRARSGAG